MFSVLQGARRDSCDDDDCDGGDCDRIIIIDSQWFINYRDDTKYGGDSDDGGPVASHDLSFVDH